MTVEERRRQFFEFFRTRAGAIAALQAPEPFRGLVDFESLRTTLVCAQLEALAKARYASREEYGRPTQRSGGRFRHLLEEHSECGDIYRLVALGRLHAHLAHAAQHARALTVRPDGKQMPASTMEAEACEEAARVVRWLLDRRGWDEARTMSRILDGTDLDLGTEAVQAALRQRGLDVLPKPVARAIHENQYAHIVWDDYRSALVHEARVRRPGFDFGEDRPPYYIAESALESDATVYSLVIPAKFLLRTLMQTIESVERFCLEHNVDPYSAFAIV